MLSFSTICSAVFTRHVIDNCNCHYYCHYCWEEGECIKHVTMSWKFHLWAGIKFKRIIMIVISSCIKQSISIGSHHETWLWYTLSKSLGYLYVASYMGRSFACGTTNLSLRLEVSSKKFSKLLKSSSSCFSKSMYSVY